MFKRILGFGVVMLFAVSLLSAQMYENSPDNLKVIPEAIWAAASGGGTWQTELQIMGRNTGTEITLWFLYGGANYRQVDLGITLNHGECYKTSNILQTLGTLDTAYDYYNKIGALFVFSQDNEHRLQVNARTWHSNGYGKSFNGFTREAGQFLDSNMRFGTILNLSNDASTRSNIACFNADIFSIEVGFYVMNSSGGFIGSFFTKTINGWDFQAFDPFAEAGLSGNFSNHFLYMEQLSGGGELFVIGASANNSTNDPSAHTLLPPSY